MNTAPMQYEFDFELDINEKGELFWEVKLHDPCQDCNESEAEQTIARTGEGICNRCAEDRHMDWVERYVDRY